MSTAFYLDVETLPARLTWERPLSDDEFEALCLDNDSVQLERTKTERS